MNNTNNRVSYRKTEAANLCGISVDSLNRLIATGQLRAKRIQPKGNGQRSITMIPHSELVRVFGI